MKKTILLLFCAVLFVSLNSNAQSSSSTNTALVSSIDPAVYQDYVGKYKFKEAPFQEVIVTVKDNKMYGEAVGQGSAELAPTKETSTDNEIYEVVGYGGTTKFIRDSSRKVVKVILNIQGNDLEGEKVVE